MRRPLAMESVLGSLNLKLGPALFYVRFSLLSVAGSSNKRELVVDDDDEQPKRPSSAFCFFMQAKKTLFIGINPTVCGKCRMRQ